MVAREREKAGLNPPKPFEKLSLNGKVVSSKELTLKELHKLEEIEAVNGVGLDDVPFILEVRDLGDSFLHIVSFSREHALDSDNLLSLLSVSPTFHVGARKD